jgi:hypothetical protein
MPIPDVTLQINLAPADLRHASVTLPHELRQFGGQVSEVLLTIDLNRNRLVDPHVWSRQLDGLRATIAACADLHPNLRSLDVDASPEVAAEVAAEWFGGEPIPAKDFRGAPIYAYFHGLSAAEHDHVLHMDSDMLYGGGSQTWIAEAVELLASRPDVPVCGPLPGPPTADGRLTSQTLLREPHDTLAFRSDRISTRSFLIDRACWKESVGRLRVAPPSRRILTWMARCDGFAPIECAEMMMSNALAKAGCSRVDFLGSGPGMWSVHPPYRSELFYERLPSLIARIERGDVPEAQRGQHDVTDAMIDWSSARKPRWRRVARHGELAVRNLAAAAGARA